MNKRDKEKALKHLRSLTDKQLIAERDDLLCQSLGSTSERMIQEDYDPIDIKERRALERYIRDCHSLADKVCEERKIK